ncbi:MAG: hypothetical protein JWO08_761 [Verrucomicrobiaceae bacterium]|nr:hypothetical protein [Verrucomicrobiaceae bacterium]
MEGFYGVACGGFGSEEVGVVSLAFKYRRITLLSILAIVLPTQLLGKSL